MTWGEVNPAEITNEIKWIEWVHQIRVEILDPVDKACRLGNKGTEGSSKGYTKLDSQTTANKWTEDNGRG